MTTVMSLGCAGGPDSFDDGIGTVTQEHSANVAPSVVPSNSTGDAGTAASQTCTTASEGCPCDRDGDSVTCQGPKIRTGNYTSCAAGIRTCAGGTWGACLGKTVYKNADTLTEDYESPCPSATAVRWGAMALQGHTPSGSSIEMLVQTAGSQASLDAAPMVRVSAFSGSTSSTWTSPDVDAALTAGGQTPAAWLRITLSVTPAPGGSSPQVVAWSQATSCVSSN